MRRLAPPGKDFMAEEASLDFSLLVPARRSAHSLERTVVEAVRFFAAWEPGKPCAFEIILIPNSRSGDLTDQSLGVAKELARRFPSVVKVAPHESAPGKGAALRTGAAHARGRFILFTDADLPYELEFFSRAIPKLREGYGLVTGNRRLPSSYFNVPVGLLPLAYGRHRLGLGFNRVVRALFPIKTSDTQAGIKAMSRELARAAFGRIECPGFLFDVEIFLVARAQGFTQLELPVTLFLNTEKSTVKVARESFSAAYWLGRLCLRTRRGDYAPPSSLSGGP